MTAVITVPAYLDEQSFEQVLEQVAPLAPDAKLLVDTRHVRFATPYGLTGLLCLAQTRAEKPDLAPPESDDVKSYWTRSAFFRYAEELFTMRGAVPKGRPHQDSDTVLEVTPIAKSEDVHTVVERVKDRATHILTHKLRLEPRATMGFTVSLSEACQNIVEHAGQGGWVAVQSYEYRKRLGGRRVVQIAVCDAGLGFRGSMEQSAARRSDRWDDAHALSEAVLRGVSRYRDPGRGHGLQGMRRWVGRWDGKLLVRSGTARLVIQPDPSWEPEPPLVDGLAPFPGAQVQITIPERVGIDTPRGERAVPAYR